MAFDIGEDYDLDIGDILMEMSDWYCHLNKLCQDIQELLSASIPQLQI